MPPVTADWVHISCGRFAGEAHVAKPCALDPNDGNRMTPTVVFDTYWRFAAERLAMFYRRYSDATGPWTSDPILKAYRFTNAYRAADRVSQYLIREVQARADRPRAVHEIFFRTMLFKIFNRIDTWEALEERLGAIEWRGVDLAKLDRTLEDLRSRGQKIYSAAYIMPSPRLGHRRKHSNHIALLAQMMEDRLPERVRQTQSLRSVYDLILRYPGIGPFLAFQYTIDLNYSSIMDFEESEFVVAGPGALDGISKCFEDTGGSQLRGRHLLDDGSSGSRVQTAWAGVSRAVRVSAPADRLSESILRDLKILARRAPGGRGIAKRTRIKQSYQPNGRPAPLPVFLTDGDRK